MTATTPANQSSRKKYTWLVILILVFVAMIAAFASGGKQQNSASLIAAIKRGDDGDAHRLLENGADPDTRDLTFRAPGSPSVLERLVAPFTGAENSGRYYPPPTALIEAILLDRTQIALDLIKHGATVNRAGSVALPDDFGYVSVDAPIVVAADRDRVDVVRALIGAGANVNQRTDPSELPALLDAVASGQPHAVEIMRMLIDHGASVKVDISGDTAFSLALQVLHDSRVHPYTAEEMERCRHEIRFLADEHAPFPKDNVWTVCEAASDRETLKTAIECGANVNVRDMRGHTPLLVGCHFNDPVIVSNLLAEDASVNVRDGSKRSPLDLTTNPQIKAMLRAAMSRHLPASPT